MKAYHTHNNHSNKPRRFSRHNLPPNTAGALLVVNEDAEIVSVFSAAARFSSTQGEVFDQIFKAETLEGVAKIQSVPVDGDAHRTTVFFNDGSLARKVDQQGGCHWVSASIRGLSPHARRPEIVWEALDPKTWLPSTEIASMLDLPVVGKSWRMASNLDEVMQKNSAVWDLFYTASVVIGGMPASAFQKARSVQTNDLLYMLQRDAELRAARSKAREERQQQATMSVLEKLSPEAKASLLAKLAASTNAATPAAVES